MGLYPLCNGVGMELSDRIGLRLKLHNLHVLMAVAEAGNMSKAAALLNTTQPAISRSIAELERTLGVRLLDRTPQGVDVTEYGRLLLHGGAAVFDDLRQVVKDIKFLADPASGELRIGCSHVLAVTFVPAVVQRVFQQYPRIVFRLVTATPESLVRELNERNVDLLIAARVRSLVDERLEFEPLFDDRGRRAPSIGTKAKDRGCRAGKRTMGADAGWRRGRIACIGNLSRQRARSSPYDCGH